MHELLKTFTVWDNAIADIFMRGDTKIYRQIMEEFKNNRSNKN